MKRFDRTAVAALPIDAMPEAEARANFGDLSRFMMAAAVGADTNPGDPVNPKDLRDLAQRIFNLADQLESAGGNPLSASHPATNDQALLKVAEKLYRDRRKREQFIPADLLSEPAWDVMLDLYINYVRGKAISTTSCCIAACVPVTTALRWISALVKRGLVRQRQSEIDHRCMMLSLTTEGVATMRSILAQ